MLNDSTFKCFYSQESSKNDSVMVGHKENPELSLKNAGSNPASCFGSFPFEPCFATKQNQNSDPQTVQQDETASSFPAGYYSPQCPSSNEDRLEHFSSGLDTFHNTTDEFSSELVKINKHCNQQERIILNFFRNHEGGLYTPFEVFELTKLELNNAPITSVRRAMSNLTKKGFLVKTSLKVREGYGKKNYLWQLNKKGADKP